MKYLLLTILLVTTLQQTCDCQGTAPIRPIQIGERVSDLRFTNLVNGSKTSMRLSDFRDKLVILDFWASWCTACLGKFETINSLQQQFSNRVAFILVTQDKRATAIETLNRLKSKKGNRYMLPSVTGDTALNLLFGHRMIPHYVWLYKGQVLAFTASDEISAKNIVAVLENRSVSMRMKNDLLDFDRTKPLFADEEVRNSAKILYSSILTGYKEGVGGGSTTEKNGKNLSRLSIHNQTILQMYQLINHIKYTRARTLLEIDDKNGVTTNEDDPLKYDKLFCYELAVPPMPAADFFERAKTDMHNYFGYTAGVETRKVKCLILTTKGTLSKQASSIETKVKGRSIIKNSLQLAELIEIKNNIPVVDESRQTLNWHSTTLPDLSNISELSSFLKSHSLTLLEGEREIELFVLKR